MYSKIRLQRGPRDEVGVNGDQVDEVLTICLERLTDFNRALPTRQTSLAITKLEEALFWLRDRTEDRIRRGVEGTNKP